MIAVVLVALASAPALAAPAGVFVPAPPPVARVERVLPRAAAPTFVWVPGHYSWSGRRYLWIRGAWLPPPRTAWIWQPPRWVVVDGRGQFFEGYWRPAVEPPPLAVYEPRGSAVVVTVAPPPPLIESRPEVPQPGAVWIPGYWHWSGRRHVWIGGVWSAPRAGFVWIAPQWQRRSDGRWQWLPGHWQRLPAGT